MARDLAHTGARAHGENGAHDAGMSAARQSDLPSPDSAILGARIARALRERGLTQTDVSRRLVVRQATVSDWIAGRHVPRGEHLRGLAGMLGMSVDELLDVTEGAAPPFASWAAFIALHPEITDEERNSLRTIRWPSGRAPGVAQYELGLMMLRGAPTRTE